MIPDKINSSSSTLLTIMSTDLELTALVNEADIGRIKKGQEVEFTSSSYSDKTFKGKVLRITPQATSVSNVQYYPVLISCADPNGELLSGMSVSVNIIVERKSNVLTIPMMAVSFSQTFLKNNPDAMQTGKTNPSSNSSGSGQMTGKPSAMSNTQNNASTNQRAQQTAAGNSQSGNKAALVVLLKNKQPSLQRVVLGLSDGSNYEVVEGLSEDDQVAVGSDQLSSQTDAAGSSSSTSNSSKQQNQQRGGGAGMGGPPPGM